MREVEEKGLCGVCFDERNGLFSVSPCDGGLLDGGLGHLLISKEGKGDVLASHIIRIGNAKIGIKSLSGWEEVGLIPEMPLADAGGGIALLLEDLGDGDFIRIEPLACCGKENPLVVLIDVHVEPAWVATGQETGAGRGADAAGDIEVGEAHALPGHLVDGWGSVLSGAKAADVAVAHVIHVDEDDVGLLGICLQGAEEEEKSENGFHGGTRR